MQSTQEIFNKIATHLLTQKAESMHVNEANNRVCAYRGEGGAMCALGCLITDANYSAELEGKGVFSYTIVKKAIAKSIGWELEDVIQREWFFHELQSLHDCEEPSLWYHRLAEFAEKYDLSMDAMKDFAPVVEAV